MMNLKILLFLVSLLNNILPITAGLIGDVANVQGFSDLRDCAQKCLTGYFGNPPAPWDAIGCGTQSCLCRSDNLSAGNAELAQCLSSKSQCNGNPNDYAEATAILSAFCSVSSSNPAVPTDSSPVQTSSNVAQPGSVLTSTVHVTDVVTSTVAIPTTIIPTIVEVQSTRVSLSTAGDGSIITLMVVESSIVPVVSLTSDTSANSDKSTKTIIGVVVGIGIPIFAALVFLGYLQLRKQRAPPVIPNHYNGVPDYQQ
ncbi:hypothetical protein AA313_de0210108 [Arthrobotrys entomopaga]|nr:hypothetical protein AA313_de0210108 [Arthrobotrys entomopaga]